MSGEDTADVILNKFLSNFETEGTVDGSVSNMRFLYLHLHNASYSLCLQLGVQLITVQISTVFQSSGSFKRGVKCVLVRQAGRRRLGERLF